GCTPPARSSRRSEPSPPGWNAASHAYESPSLTVLEIIEPAGCTVPADVVGVDHRGRALLAGVSSLSPASSRRGPGTPLLPVRNMQGICPRPTRHGPSPGATTTGGALRAPPVVSGVLPGQGRVTGSP